ncbi:MAG: alpha/beta fold hydrolase [Burkholderiaceae bacterium]|jgi:predicted alpha/beta-fold hydrolase
MVGRYRAPLWLRDRHSQTIIPASFLGPKAPPYRRERWNTPDGDFIDLDWVDPVEAESPTVILFHGLEGSSQSHYARALMHHVRLRGWRGVVPHFRGCSGDLNQAPRFYHSGDSTEVHWVLERLHTQLTRTALYVVGVSLGGNALLRWLGERAEDATKWVQSAAAISAPLDLAAGGNALGRGFNRVYTEVFLRTLKPKCEQKLAQFPGLFDREAMLAARDLHAFDDVVTGPLHGFRDADDYWNRASSKWVLPAIAVPTLVLNAVNDPFLPAHALPLESEVSRAVRLEYPLEGGHVGFYAAAERAAWLPLRTLDFLENRN